MSDGLRAFLALGGAGLLAVVAVPLARRIAVATDFLDHPLGYGYKDHAGSTPYLGGAAVMVAFAAAALILGGGFPGIPGVVALALLLALMGTIDDRRPLGPGLRFGIQLGAGIPLR